MQFRHLFRYAAIAINISWQPKARYLDREGHANCIGVYK